MKEESDFDFNSLFKKKDKLVFLIGAGCSVDSPSCLPAGRWMIETIVRYTCPESEISKILEIKELRFEALVEIIRDRMDEELKLIEYYAQCNKPNIQHFLLVTFTTFVSSTINPVKLTPIHFWLELLKLLIGSLPFGVYYLPVAAIVFGIIGLIADESKGMAIGGLIFGIFDIVFILFILPMLLIFLILAGLGALLPTL